MSQEQLDVLFHSLDLLWKGMATILIGMILICGVIYLLNFLTKEKKN